MNRIFAQIFVVQVISVYFCVAESQPPTAHTTVTTKNVTREVKIDYTLVEKPHHLFIGRCTKEDQILHQENIVLNNDGKSHVYGNIKISIDGMVTITCVNIFDEMNEPEAAYPSYAAGGVGYNFVEFNVLTRYGKGFKFFVQIFGRLKNKATSE